jgi:hypothetical protein
MKIIKQLCISFGFAYIFTLFILASLSFIQDFIIPTSNVEIEEIKLNGKYNSDYHFICDKWIKKPHSCSLKEKANNITLGLIIVAVFIISWLLNPLLLGPPGFEVIIGYPTAEIIAAITFTIIFILAFYLQYIRNKT